MNRAMTRITAVCAAAGATAAVFGASTTLRYEVSADQGASWSSSTFAQPGGTVQVRARVIWSGAEQVSGLSQLVFQPVVTGWTDSDRLITDPSSPGGMGIEPGPGTGGTREPPPPGAYGRVDPFRANSTSTSSFLRGHVGSGTASGLLRIAQAYVTNWIGEGPTSGAGAINNLNGNGGVSVAQIAPGTRLPTDPPSNLENDVVVLKFGYVVGQDGANYVRDMVIDTPLAGLGHETNNATGHYGDLYAAWFTSSTAAQGTRFYADVGTELAVVHVVPAPGTVMLMGLVAARRRRRV